MVETFSARLVAHMNGEELQKRCITLFGKKHWKKVLAEKCGKDFSTIWRWLASEKPIPRYVEIVLEAIEQQKKLERITSSLNKQLR